jgi:predicted aspartyl protease
MSVRIMSTVAAIHHSVRSNQRGAWAISSAALLPMAMLSGLMMGLVLHQPAATAQEDPCYMITSSGRRVSLGKLCGSGNSVKAPTAPTGMIQAKIKRRSGGTPVIDVTFNGNQTFEMLLDTGASGTLITRSMARSLRLPIIGVDQFIMADGRTVLMPLGRIQSMAIQNAVVKNVNVAIAPDSADGLLGHDFLGNYDIKIKRDVVEFYPRS